MMKKIQASFKKLLSMLLAMILITSLVPAQALAAGVNSLVESLNDEYWLENNAIHVDVSKNSGAFYIRTVAGDKLVKGDEYANLLWPGEDDTSFTTVRITRGGVTKDYIFGKNYGSGNEITVTNDGTQIVSVWTVDSVTFTQTITLQPTNNDTHGMVVISYSAKNTGEAADIGIRVLLDTAMGGKDYAYYSTGSGYPVENEQELGVNGYDKSIYMMDDPSDPLVTGYILNGSVDGAEKKPVKTILAHWANLAAAVYDYTPDTSLYFTNAFNARHMTSDSAVALYYNLGTIVPNASASTQFNYGLYSNEKVKGYKVAVNLQTVDALSYTDESESAFENDGKFTAKTILQNASQMTYGKVRIYAFASGGIQVLNADQSAVNASGKTYGYDNPYYVEINDFVPGQKANNLSLWNFHATMAAEANYGRIHFKVYDMTNSDVPLENNLIGEAKKYILVPGSTEKLPQTQLTGSAPEIFHTEGHRVFNVTGLKFSGLEAEAYDRYTLKLSRKDGKPIRDNDTSLTLPAPAFEINEDGSGMMTVTIDGDLSQGEYKITIDYTDPDREDIDAKALEFQIIDDTRYRCETYGLVCVYMDEATWDDGTHPRQDYRVGTFSDENMFNEWKEFNHIEDTDVLMIFRGVFDDLTNSLPEGAASSLKENEEYVTYLKANLTDQNTVIMNRALQFSCDEEGDNVVIKQIRRTVEPDSANDTEKHNVKVDMDCKVSISGVGTPVYNGVCCFTELKADTRYKLIEYDEAGERNDTVGNSIVLLWPSVSFIQTNIMGAFFNFHYGELGAMVDDDGNILTRTVGFGGGLDLSCIIPGEGEGEDMYENGMEWTNADSIAFSPDEQRAWNEANDIRRQNRSFSEKNKDRAQSEVANGFYDDDGNINYSASVQVRDILFGSNSFIGFNFSVGVGIPPLAYGLPSIEGVFTLRTIGQTEFRVNGQMNFITVQLEALLDLKANDIGILIPDEFKFFVGGFTPGTPLDPWGVLWLQGGGGGIKDIYETIYLQDKVPPIKLILQAQFSVLQLMVAKATVEAGLTGFGIALNDVRITATNIPIIDSAVVALRWYPNFALIASLQVDLLDMIKGGGYIVGYSGDPGFFEFFVRAALHLPGDIPVVGGMTLGGVNMGISTERIFGRAETIGIGIGFSYYWRNEFDWGTKNEASPTFPELLGLGQEFDTDIDEMFEDIPTGKSGAKNTKSLINVRGVPLMQEEDVGVPVYYDKENHRTLMAVAGTNFVKGNTVVLRGGNDQAASTQNTLLISPDGLSVEATFGANAKSKILLLTWDSASEEAAQTQAASLNAGDYAIILLDHNTDAAEQTDANANLTYDPETQKATLAITVTDSSVTEMNIRSGFAMDAVIYDVEALPELEEEDCSAELVSTGASAPSQLNVSVGGNQINEFDFINVGIVGIDDLNLPDNEVPQLDIVGRIEKENGRIPTSARIELPSDLPTGTYVVRLLAQDKEQTQSSVVDLIQHPINFVNPNTPSDPTAIGNITGAGDWKVNIPITAGEGDFDGYSVTVTDSEGKGVSGLTDLLFYKNGEHAEYDAEGLLTVPEDNTDAGVLTIGGHMEVPVSDTVEEDGSMTANEETMTQTEILGFTAGSYTVSVKKWNAPDGVPIYSNAITRGFTVSAPDPANVTITGDSAVSRTEQRDEETISVPYYSGDELTLTLTSDKPVTESWVLDGDTDTAGYSGIIDSSTNDSINLGGLGLPDGVHTISFTGSNESGDVSGASYVFGVDNTAPEIQISSPVNGGTFDAQGRITFTGTTDPGAAITFYDQTTGRVLTPLTSSTDPATGEFTATVSLTSNVSIHKLLLIAEDDLGNRSERSFTLRNGLLTEIKTLHLYEGSVDVTEMTLAAGTHTLRLVGTTEEGQIMEFNDPSLIEWGAQILEGSTIVSALSEDGTQFTVTAEADTVGVITGQLLVNDAGSYPVSCMVGSTLSVNPGDITVEVDGTTSISVSAETDTTLTFTSGDDNVATVQADSDGIAIVTGVNAGTTTITVTASTGETVTVNVTVRSNLYTVTIDADEGSIVNVIANDDIEGGTPITSGDAVPGGTVLTVFAQPKAGYSLTALPEDSYTVDDDLTITARSEIRHFTVTAAATAGGAAPTQEPANPVPYGTEVTLTAGAADSGYEFVGWYKTNGKRLTTESVYTVTVSSDVTYEARYQSVTGVVTFMANGNVQKTISGKTGITSEDFPADATPYSGFVFAGWDKTADDINAALSAGESVTVTALFNPVKTNITVTIYNGEKEEPEVANYTESTIVTVTADVVADKTFSHWELDGELMGYNRKASFRATESCTLTAVYTTEAVEAIGTAALRTSLYNESTKKLVTNVYLTVPDGAKIVAAGLYAASGSGSYDPSAELNADNADYVKVSSAAVGKSAPVSYTWTKSSVSIGDVWYLRAYISYTLNNEKFTVCGDRITVKAGQDYDCSEKGTAVIKTMSYDSGAKKAKFIAYMTAPEESSIVKAGLVAASGNNFDPTTAILTAANADYVKSSTAAVGKCAPVSYTWTKSNVNTGDTWYVRAYLVYDDSTGTQHTVYGELVSYTAN